MSVDLYDPAAPTATSDVDLVSALVTAEGSGSCGIVYVDTHIPPCVPPSCVPDAMVVVATTYASASDSVATSSHTSLELTIDSTAYYVAEQNESSTGLGNTVLHSQNSDSPLDDANLDRVILPQEPLEQSVLAVSVEPTTSSAMFAMEVGIAMATPDESSPNRGDPLVMLNVQKDEATVQLLQQDASPATPHNGQLEVQIASIDEGQKSSPAAKKEMPLLQTNSGSRQGSGSPVVDREKGEEKPSHRAEPGWKSRDRYIGHRKPLAREERRNSDHEDRSRSTHEEKKPDREDGKRAERDNRRPSDFEDRKRTDFHDRRRADYGDRRHVDPEDRKRPDHDDRKHLDYEDRRRAGHEDRRNVEREGQRRRELFDRRQSTQDSHRRLGNDDRKSPHSNNERPFDRDSHRHQGRSDVRCRVGSSDGGDKLTNASKKAPDRSSKPVHRGRSRSRSLTPGRHARPSSQHRVSDHHSESLLVRRTAYSDARPRPSPVADGAVRHTSRSPTKSRRRSRDSPGAKQTGRPTSVEAIAASPQAGGGTNSRAAVPLDRVASGGRDQSGESSSRDTEVQSSQRRGSCRSSNSPQAAPTVQSQPRSHAEAANPGDGAAAGGPAIPTGELRSAQPPAASQVQQGPPAASRAAAEGGSKSSYFASEAVSSLSFTELMRLPPPPLPPPTLIMPMAPGGGPAMMAGMPPMCFPPPSSSLLLPPPQSLSLQFVPAAAAHHGLLAHHGVPPSMFGLLQPQQQQLGVPPPHGLRPPPPRMPPFIPPSSSGGPPLFVSQLPLPPASGLQSYAQMLLLPPPAGHSPFAPKPRSPFAPPPPGPPTSEPPPPPPPPPASSYKVHGIDRLVGVHGGSLGPHGQRQADLQASPPPPPDFFTGSENGDAALKARSNLIVIQPNDAAATGGGPQARQATPSRQDAHDRCSSSDDMTEAPMDMTGDDDDDDNGEDDDEQQDDDVDFGASRDVKDARSKGPMVNGREPSRGSVPPSDGPNSLLAATAGRVAASQGQTAVVHVGQGDVADVPAAHECTAEAAQPRQRTVEVLQQLQQLLSRGGPSQQGHDSQAKSEMHTGVLGAVLSGKASSNDMASSEELPRKMKKAGAATRAQTLKIKESPGSDIPSSATELSNLKAIEKMNRQERIAEEVKVVLKPYYRSGKISKAEYKDIMKKAVHKIYSSRSGAINPAKVKIFIDGYVAKTIQTNKLQRKRQQVPS